jgi:hypothetical protein
MKLLDKIEIDLRNHQNEILTVYIDVFDNSLSQKWLNALNVLISDNYHLEKNYCWFGFVEGERNASFICDQINRSINAINSSGIGYSIKDYFSPKNTIVPGPIGDGLPGGGVNHNKLNWLHRYFEDLQGVSGAMSQYYNNADANTRWHIRQLNLLCHEYESLVLSMRKIQHAPDWRRPSQLMCWLNAPRFELDSSDYELFGVDTLSRKTGGVYVGVNKAVGKHHWEVFNDEGRDIGELITTSLRGQTEAAGDFDIEWARDPSTYSWQIQDLAEFRKWLKANGFDPEDKSLTIGHPQVGQVDLLRSFGTDHPNDIWTLLGRHLDVYKIRTSDSTATYEYRWNDADFIDRQIRILS